MVNIGVHLDADEVISFKFGVMIDMTAFLCQFIDLDLHSRSQDYEKARTCNVILLKGGMKWPKLM